MSITMHSASVPVFVRMLNNMLIWLDKAEAHAKARKFDPNNYLSMRLMPDMLPFSRASEPSSFAAGMDCAYSIALRMRARSASSVFSSSAHFGGSIPASRATQPFT